jgi:hypothetical protein
MTKLLNDMARCNGYEKEHICTKCERKAQILRDDPSKFYWMMGPAVEHGRCEYLITAPKQEPGK